jgi:hypothetical protein
MGFSDKFPKVGDKSKLYLGKVVHNYVVERVWSGAI